MAYFHPRSTSFPSKSHPLIASIEEQIYQLKKSESSSIGQKLCGLKELYECVDDYLQTFSHEKHNRSTDEALNGSLRVLDMCSTTRDFFSQMKQCVRSLESSLRRRRRSDAESNLHEVDAYAVARKKLVKFINKYLRNLKRHEKNCRRTTLSDDNSLESTTRMLRDAEELSVSVFESVLSFIFQTNAKSKLSIFSKLLQSKNLLCEAEIEENEAEKIDSELIIFKSNKDNNQVEHIIRGLEGLELSLEEIENDLECVYRRLVKTRVLLLNILNH